MGQRNVTLQLLAAGALQVRDELGRAPLHSAVIAGHLELSQLLLHSGAYIELRDLVMRTPLHHAARLGHMELTRMLLDEGAYVMAIDQDRRSALHYTVRDDKMLNTTVLLRQRGADIETEDIIGFRPLHFACYENNPKTVEFLFGLGADVYAMDLAGWNPLVHAAARGYEELVNYLVIKTLRPDVFPTADPARIAYVAQTKSVDFFGLPPILVAVGFALSMGLLLVVPVVIALCVFGKAKQPYLIHDVDNTTEDMLNDVFEMVVTTKGMQEKICVEWDKIPAHCMNDIHRPTY